MSHCRACFVHAEVQDIAHEFVTSAVFNGCLLVRFLRALLCWFVTSSRLATGTAPKSTPRTLCLTSSGTGACPAKRTGSISRRSKPRLSCGRYGIRVRKGRPWCSLKRAPPRNKSVFTSRFETGRRLRVASTGAEEAVVHHALAVLLLNHRGVPFLLLWGRSLRRCECREVQADIVEAV